MMKSATRRLNVGRYVLAVLLLVTGTGMSSVPGEPLRFRTVASGIEHVTFQVRPEDAQPFSGHAFKIDLDMTELRLVTPPAPASRRTVEEIVAPYSAVVAINASFFDKDGRAMGVAVDQGRLVGGGTRQSWGALVVDDRKARIVLGSEIDNPLAHHLVVQGIPRLVVGGKVPQLKTQSAERTAVCAEASVIVLVVSTKAESTRFARFLADPADKGGLGCGDALNLDGGPSTQLVVKLPGLALSIPGGWGVPNALMAAPGKR
jgi:exopolysaccharide biosynthesis protein